MNEENQKLVQVDLFLLVFKLFVCCSEESVFIKLLNLNERVNNSRIGHGGTVFLVMPH